MSNGLLHQAVSSWIRGTMEEVERPRNLVKKVLEIRPTGEERQEQGVPRNERDWFMCRG